MTHGGEESSKVSRDIFWLYILNEILPQVVLKKAMGFNIKNITSQGEGGTVEYHQMSHGGGIEGGAKIIQKKFHVLFEWPLMWSARQSPNFLENREDYNYMGGKFGFLRMYRKN